MQRPVSVLEEIREYWGWVGIEPTAVVGENDFGNLIVEDDAGRYWRLCPEDCYCRVIAENRAQLDALSIDPEFLEDWHMSQLVAQARERCGPLTDGRKYCLRIPGVLGGEYGGSNLATAPQVELVRISGDIARQIADLPDGATVRFRFVE